MGKIEESCLNRVKKYCLLNETYYSGITEEEKKSLIALIKTAKDTDGKTTTFPDFIGENGWIEHFKVTSSQSSKKGYESITATQKCGKMPEFCERVWVVQVWREN